MMTKKSITMTKTKKTQMTTMRRKIKKRMMKKQGSKLKTLIKSKISIGVSMVSSMQKRQKLSGTFTNLWSKPTKTLSIGIR